MPLHHLLDQGQGFFPFQTIASPGGLGFHHIQRVHIEACQSTGQQPEKLRADFTEEIARERAVHQAFGLSLYAALGLRQLLLHPHAAGAFGDLPAGEDLGDRAGLEILALHRVEDGVAVVI